VDHGLVDLAAHVPDSPPYGELLAAECGHAEADNTSERGRGRQCEPSPSYLAEKLKDLQFNSLGMPMLALYDCISSVGIFFNAIDRA
jgi:hypothetical protein